MTMTNMQVLSYLLLLGPSSTDLPDTKPGLKEEADLWKSVCFSRHEYKQRFPGLKGNSKQFGLCKDTEEMGKSKAGGSVHPDCTAATMKLAFLFRRHKGFSTGRDVIRSSSKKMTLAACTC